MPLAASLSSWGSAKLPLPFGQSNSTFACTNKLPGQIEPNTGPHNTMNEELHKPYCSGLKISNVGSHTIAHGIPQSHKNAHCCLGTTIGMCSMDMRIWYATTSRQRRIWSSKFPQSPTNTDYGGLQFWQQSHPLFFPLIYVHISTFLLSLLL